MKVVLRVWSRNIFDFSEFLLFSICSLQYAFQTSPKITDETKNVYIVN